MTQGESRDKARVSRMLRLEKRIVTHRRLLGEARDVEAYARNSTAVIGAQQEMIELLVGVVRDQATAVRTLRDAVPAEREERSDGDATSAT